MRPDFIEKSLVNQMVFYQWIAHSQFVGIYLPVMAFAWSANSDQCS